MNDLGIHPVRPRNGLSLCAGGGGLDMGLMLAEPGFHTRCLVEWEPYPQECLIAAQRAGYLAPAPVWTDLRTFDATPWAGHIDTLLAGYPCQPFSAAGQRRGEDDERHLWPDVARCARELGDGLEWIFLENVAGHVSLGLETVLRELWDMGFTPAAGLFSAGETGAAHERLRVFIVAHRDRNGRERRQKLRARWNQNQGECGTHAERQGCSMGHPARIGCGEGGPEPGIRSWRNAAACAGGAVDNSTGSRSAEAGWGANEWPDRDECREMADAYGGNACPEWEQRGGQQRFQPESGPAGSTADDGMADTRCSRPQGREWRGSPAERHGTPAHGSASERRRPRVHAPGPGDRAGWAQTLAARPDLAPAMGFDDCLAWAGRLAADIEGSGQAAAEPALRRMADGLATRSRALRLLGNGVHPLAAGYAWRTLADAHGLGAVDMGAVRR